MPRYFFIRDTISDMDLVELMICNIDDIWMSSTRTGFKYVKVSFYDTKKERKEIIAMNRIEFEKALEQSMLGYGFEMIKSKIKSTEVIKWI